MTFPTSRAELRAEVDAVLAGLTGSDPEHDEDDDVLVRRGGTAAWVRVHRHAPVVELFAIVVDEVTDQKAAQFELSVLNRGFGFVRYELMDDRVFARVAVPANPFVPSHLRHLLDVLFEAVERVGPDLAHRICAETDDTEDEDEEADARVASALRVVLELDAAEPGSVGPSLAAAICDHDQRLLVEVLTSARQVLGEAKAAAGRL